MASLNSTARWGSVARSRRRRNVSLSGRPLAERQGAEFRGRLAEWIAMALLILKGYRILGRRLRGPFGEIDLVAVRGRRVAFVEVKQRRHRADAEAAAAGASLGRVENAVERWLWRHPRYRKYRVGLDAVVLGAGLWPRHLPDALHAW